MRSGTIIRRAAGAAWLLCLAAHALTAHADEPTRFGRLFRLGATTNSANPGSTTPATSPAITTLPTTPSARSVADTYGQPALSTPPTTAAGVPLTPTPRITPKPRVNKPATEADPLVSRIALGRADGGSQFGIFTQVFADGTVIDGEGVHKVSPDLLKPIVEAVSSGDFGRIKGHCGGPAGDTYENFHVVTYERAYGRLRANAFSYSGNPQGCDHAVHHLHKALDELQMKMTTGGSTTASALTPTVVAPASAAAAPVSATAGPALTAPITAAPAAMAPGRNPVDAQPA